MARVRPLNFGVRPSIAGRVAFPEAPPMILGLRTAIYPAPDLDAAKRWYAEVLAMAPYFDEPFYVGFSVGGFELGLVPNGTPGIDGPQPLWGVADIASAYARLLQLGAVSLDSIADVGGGIKVAAVTDPFGNRLGIIENPHFNAGAVR
jgi:catechol 2,3-dioxygenase-like lactoylglutathione lyase family enzyme